MVEFCEKKSIYLIMDDIYNRLVFDGKSAPICYDFVKAPIEESKLVVINGVSKMYAMTGFRIGWAIASKPLIEAMATIQSQQTSGPSAPSQWAAVGALNGVQSSIESLRLTLENNRNVMMDRLQAFDGVKVHKPDGTFYCFPDFSAYMKDSQKLCQFPARESAGGHGAGQGIRLRGAPAAELLRHHQGHHRGPGAHQVGARSELAQ